MACLLSLVFILHRMAAQHLQGQKRHRTNSGCDIDTMAQNDGDAPLVGTSLATLGSQTFLKRSLDSQEDELPHHKKARRELSRLASVISTGSLADDEASRSSSLVVEPVAPGIVETITSFPSWGIGAEFSYEPDADEDGELLLSQVSQHDDVDDPPAFYPSDAAGVAAGNALIKEVGTIGCILEHLLGAFLVWWWTWDSSIWCGLPSGTSCSVRLLSRIG